MNTIYCKNELNLLEVKSPFDNSLVGVVTVTDSQEIPSIMNNARTGAKISGGLSKHSRAEILFKAAAKIEEDFLEFANLIARESGKTIKHAKKEVLRCINTIRLSAEEAKRLSGEVIPFDSYVGSENRTGYFTYEPLGIILAITPFNDPLNLVAHKLGPAFAAGNSIILKPSKLAPLSAQKLVQYLWAAGVPKEVIQIIHGSGKLASEFLSQRDIRMVSFTGGPATGEKITKEAGLKKIAMDLGGNAPVIVMADCNLMDAAESCVSGAFWAAGQNCIGTQRIFIARSIYDSFVKCMVSITEEMNVGNPLDDSTDMGPMISEEQAVRIEKWVDEAVSQGAKVLVGHKREGAVYFPTIIENVPYVSKCWSEEVFAPVVIVEPFDDLDEAIRLANSSESSLHAGIFTSNLHIASKLSKNIQAGGVMINDSSDYRFDGMPFGGFKYGSLGREGVRFSIHEMSQPKVVCYREI